MKKLNKYLSDWESAGFINSGQIRQIREFEASRSKTPWIMYGFIMLGVSIVSIGIISLVAANWRDIPGSLKLTVDMIFLLSIALSIYKVSDKEKPLAFDALVALFIFFYLASIGLVSQIYHTGGEPYQALLLVSIVMFPVMLMTYGRFLPNTWVVLFLASLILYDVYCFQYYAVNEKTALILIGFTVSTPFICAIFGNAAALGNTTKKLSLPFIFWAIISYLPVIVLFDAGSFEKEFYQGPRNFFNELETTTLLPYILITAVTMVATTSLFWTNKYIPKKVKVLSTILILVYFKCINFHIWFDIDYYRHPYLIKVSGVLFTISTLLILSLIFSSFNMKKLFNFMVLLIGARFLVIYFQLIGSLAYTGFGLIISGLLIIGFVVLWYKHRKTIEEKLGRLIK